MRQDERRYVITFGCPDRVGIVARISAFLAELGGWIVEAGYHTDHETNWFLTRQEVRADSIPFEVDELRRRFAAVVADLTGEPTDPATGLRPTWRITDTRRRKRVVILVSREAHCLYDLLGRVSTGELDIEVAAVIGNHADMSRVTEAHDIDFHHVPFPADPAAKLASFAEVRELVDAHDPDAIVLAKFMQILPLQLCEAWSGRAINIHHSFLPSFVGARPYHQAHERGVKLIGATCHYVTGELDAGPIIEQDVIRVDHRDTVADMVRKGRDAEKLVLAKAVRWHLQERVLLHGKHTVIF